VQKLLSNPPLFAVPTLTGTVERLHDLVDQVMYQAMKKKPKRVEQVKEACVGA
jgi:hypothetical protein